MAGKTGLDLGASTGGFTQVLLERGAAKVYAVDVGHGQLHASLRADRRRRLPRGRQWPRPRRAINPRAIDLLVSDVSFVSILKVIAASLDLCRSGAEAVLLIKPQFEVGREHIGKGGIVRDPAAIVRANDEIVDFLAARNWRHIVSVPSPISGGDGNLETVAAFRKAQS